jgi:hypothetical protein
MALVAAAPKALDEAGFDVYAFASERLWMTLRGF